MRTGRICSLVLLVLLTFVSAVLAQEIGPIQRQSSTVDLAESMKKLLREADVSDTTALKAMVEAFLAGQPAPGVQLLLYQDSNIVWGTSHGWADIEKAVPVTDTTLFLLASTSKPFVAVAAMQLVEQGRLDLDADINGYLPFVVSSPFHSTATITMRHLLTHTSGLARRDSVWIDLMVFEGADYPIPLAEFLEDWFVYGGAHYQRINYTSNAPGTNWHYSNVAYALAGLVVEQIAGTTLQGYCQDSIFLPLGMNETSWFIADLDSSQIASPYKLDQSTGILSRHPHWGSPPYPSTQLRTSARQLARFSMAMMNYGELNGRRILDSSTVAEIFTIQFPALHDSTDWGFWGVGFYNIPYYGDYYWGHDGWMYGYASINYFDIEAKVGIVLLCNLGWPEIGPGFFEIADNSIPFLQDTDTDGYLGVFDNCPTTFNPDQIDLNGDGVGDACCCIGTRGDINGDGADLDIVDLTCLVDYLFGTGCDMPCPDEADVNVDGTSGDIVDLTLVVDWLFGVPPPGLFGARPWPPWCWR